MFLCSLFVVLFFFGKKISIQSGLCGAAPYRGLEGETIQQINARFPHWFCEEFKKFGDETKEIMFDSDSVLKSLKSGEFRSLFSGAWLVFCIKRIDKCWFVARQRICGPIPQGKRKWRASAQMLSFS